MRKNDQKICFSAGVKYKGCYYLVAMRMNALFMYDELENKLTFLTCFQKEQKQHTLYLKAFLYKEEAWFIPWSADNIAIVNLEKMSIKYMPLLYHKEFHNTYIKYVNILFFKNNFLCLIPNDVDTVMIIDLENKKAEAYYEIVKAKENYHGAVFFDEKIYFFPWIGENMLVLDLKTNKRVYKPWTKGREDFGDAVYDEELEQLFHAPLRENYIRVDNLYGESIKKIYLDNLIGREYKTYYAISQSKEIFFWGNRKNVVLKVNKKDCSVKLYWISQDLSESCYFPIHSDAVEALVCDGNCIVRYNEKKDKFDCIYINATYNMILHEIISFGINLGIDIKNIIGSMENNFWRLQQFVFYIQIKKSIGFYNPKDCIGKLIYENICIERSI